ncbi:hypothetical protein [Streptomyces xylophagus]|uniref:hypothetical protein n=1 Tax=Streptomyces xylophagus TaxID=285514 RepID=UPI0005B8F36A|nr:hypothetical protein [Streptomyces xylophagus]
MKRGDSDYEAALEAVVDILKDRARSGCQPMTYGDLSAQLIAGRHDVPAHQGPGFYRLARRPPYAASRKGDNDTIWIMELEALRREYHVS